MNLISLAHCHQSQFRILTVAFIQAEAAIAEAEFSCPVGPWHACRDPGAVVPAAVRFGVHFQTGLDEVQLSLKELLHIILFSRAHGRYMLGQIHPNTSRNSKHPG